MGEKVNGGDNGGRRWQRQMQEDAMADENGKTVDEWVEELEGLAEEEKWEEMLSASEVCVKEHPEEAVGYFFTGFANDEIGNKDIAISNYNRAVEIGPVIAPYLHNRGNTYAKLKQFDKAIADFQAAKELYQSALRHDNADKFSARNLIQVETGITMALIQKEHQEQTEKLRNDYISYNPHEITEHYKSEIDRIDQELYGMTIEEQLSELNSFQKFLLKQRRVVFTFSLVFLYMILVLIFVRGTTCYEKSFFACTTKNDILILLPIFAFIMFSLLAQLTRQYKFGLLEKAKEISSNLRIVSLLQ